MQQQQQKILNETLSKKELAHFSFHEYNYTSIKLNFVYFDK